MSDKIYVPKSKAKAVTTKFGQVLKLGFQSEALIEFVKANTNQAGYVNIDIVPRKEADQYGNTHSCVLNNWKPDASKITKPDDSDPFA